MSKELSTLDFTGQNIYVGLDVSKNSWSVCILTDQFEHKRFSQAPDPDALVKYLHKNLPGATYLCVYEAGFCGFWAQRTLSELGVDCIVVHPLDVPTKGKERSNRRDRVDARKLARSLRNGDLEPVYVPDPVAEQDRALVRNRHGLVKKYTRCRNQIKAFLFFLGIELPEDLARSRWSRKYVDYLRSVPVQHHSGRRTLDGLLAELDFLAAQIAVATEEIRLLADQERYRNNVQLLCTIPGIALLSAMILLTELVTVARFKNLDNLASYVGLVPGEDSSGDKEIITGLTYRRNAFLRRLIIECSWITVRKDPALLQCFTELTKRMKKNQAIIRIARKLLNRIRYVLINQEPYVECVVA